MRIFGILLICFLWENAMVGQAGEVLSLSTIRHDSIDIPTQGGAFGIAVTSIGDLDQDGVEDLAVGARNIGPITNRGTVYILFMDTTGNYKSYTKIASGISGFNQSTGFEGNFGESVTCLGDIDGDGTTEIAVGNPFNNGAGVKEGVVWLLSLKTDGTVAKSLKIGEGTGGFSGNLENNEGFGFSVSMMPDVDNDGVPELLIGAPNRDVPSSNSGRVYLLKLTSSGSVQDVFTYDDSSPLLNFSGAVGFGQAVSFTDDLDGNGVPEIIVGVPGDNVVNGKTRGSISVLFLDSQLNLSSVKILNDTSPNFTSLADSVGRYGRAVCNMGDLDGDGFDDLAIGALEGEINPSSSNMVILLFLDNQGNLKSSTILIAASGTPFTSFTNPGIDFSGRALAKLQDMNGDGKHDLLAGAPAFNNGNGQIHILTLDGVSHIGQSENPIAKQGTVYPNPFTAYLTIESPTGEAYGYELYDALGKKHQEGTLPENNRIDIHRDLPRGHYYLKLVSKSGRPLYYQLVK